MQKITYWSWTHNDNRLLAAHLFFRLANDIDGRLLQSCDCRLRDNDPLRRLLHMITDHVATCRTRFVPGLVTLEYEVCTNPLLPHGWLFWIGAHPKRWRYGTVLNPDFVVIATHVCVIPNPLPLNLLTPNMPIDGDGPMG